MSAAAVMVTGAFYPRRTSGARGYFDATIRIPPAIPVANIPTDSQ